MRVKQGLHRISYNFITIIFFETYIQMDNFQSHQNTFEHFRAHTAKPKLEPIVNLSEKGKAVISEIHNGYSNIRNQQRQSSLNQEKESQNEVPIVKIGKKKAKANLVVKASDNEKQKDPCFARGILVDNTKNTELLRGQIDFIGNFKGVFLKDRNERNQIIYYFQGEVSSLKILKINGRALTNEQKELLSDLTQMKGYFLGVFLPLNAQDWGKEEDWTGKKIKEEVKSIEYHVPTLVRMDIRKITQINLEKSSAEIAATLKIDIQLNQETLDLVYDQKEGRFSEKKYRLNIDTHRGKPFVLPFYDPEDFDEDTDEEEQYEWDDVWEGIDLEVEWSRELMKMSYRIRTTYTAEIDNSHGIFYAPFNLNTLKIVIDFHSIKIKSGSQPSKKICFNCCELTDYNTNAPYTPYTYFGNLEKNPSADYRKVYKKHIDRLNKIDTTQFVDQGEFKVANNRLALFPYYKRVFKNKNKVTSDLSWTLGRTEKDSMLEVPALESIQEGYSRHVRGEEVDMFKLEQWEFVHIEIPIFKYAVIDIIRIFVPITILSAISMTMFWQENAKDYSGFTELAKRIASGCSLMVAYVALIPMIRANLPPTPSITLVEILIYLSVIPNFLAILSTLVASSMDTDQFFRTYKAFIDPLFLISFIICCASSIILILKIIEYAKKDYQSDFTINKFRSSPMKNLRAPTFKDYIKSVKGKRPEYIIEELAIPYAQYKQIEEEDD